MSIPTKIIALLRTYPDTILTKELIFKKCWGRPYMAVDGSTFYVNVCLARRLLADGRIVCVYGKGYKWLERE